MRWVGAAVCKDATARPGGCAHARAHAHRPPCARLGLRHAHAPGLDATKLRMPRARARLIHAPRARPEPSNARPFPRRPRFPSGHAPHASDELSAAQQTHEGQARIGCRGHHDARKRPQVAQPACTPTLLPYHELEPPARTRARPHHAWHATQARAPPCTRPAPRQPTRRPLHAPPPRPCHTQIKLELPACVTQLHVTSLPPAGGSGAAGPCSVRAFARDLNTVHAARFAPLTTTSLACEAGKSAVCATEVRACGTVCVQACRRVRVHGPARRARCAPWRRPTACACPARGAEGPCGGARTCPLPTLNTVIFSIAKIPCIPCGPATPPCSPIKQLAS